LPKSRVYVIITGRRCHAAGFDPHEVSDGCGKAFLSPLARYSGRGLG
jgi:hypothetical protein